MCGPCEQAGSPFPGAQRRGHWPLRAATLIEVMVALVLLGVVMVGTAGFFGYSSGQIAVARSKRLALELASARLDELRASDYAEIAQRTETDVSLGSWTADVTTDVTEHTEGPAQYKEVSVTVAWQTGDSQHELSLRSILGKK